MGGKSPQEGQTADGATGTGRGLLLAFTHTGRVVTTLNSSFEDAIKIKVRKTSGNAVRSSGLFPSDRDTLNFSNRFTFFCTLINYTGLGWCRFEGVLEILFVVVVVVAGLDNTLPTEWAPFS